MNAPLFDTHAHLDFPDFEQDLDAVLERARRAGVEYIITIGSGSGLGNGPAALALAREHEKIWATAGVHPHDAKLVTDDLPQLAELAQDPKFVAVGEIGLDYAKAYSPIDVQKKIFRLQLDLARQLDLPVVIHDRDAHEDLLAILKRDGVPPRAGVMHCFSGDADLAAELIGLGLFISFPGVVTFKNAKTTRAAAAAAPLDRILIETDCPFLAPAPHRGKRNEPAYVRMTAETIAGLRGLTLDQAARATTGNAFRAFPLDR